MKKLFNLTMIGLFAFFIGIFYGMFSYAQEAVESVVAVTEMDVLKSAFQLVSNFKEMSAFAAALAITQLLRMVLSLPSLGSLFPSLTSKMKLLVISLLSVVSGVLSLRVAGMSWAECLLHSGTLAAVQVFAHQYYKEFVQKPAESPQS